MAAPFPEAVTRIVDRLAEAGHSAALVGGCVRDHLRGVAVRDYDITTSAPPELTLALFPRAVPIGLRFGTVMVPTAVGPVDVTCWRGPSLREDLAHRDFTVNAMALHPESGAITDPFGGRADLRAGRLRAVGSARARLAEDPLRALRAVRLVAELGLEPDTELATALPEFATALKQVAPERVWNELARLLAAPGVGRGLAWLKRSGIEDVLVPGNAPDAATVVAALPADLTLRLAAWLRGARAGAILAKLRVSRPRVREVERILALHPLDRAAAPRDGALRRVLRRAGGEENLFRLFALREAELRAAAGPPDEAARGALRALRERAEAIRGSAVERGDLALDGRQVMTLLGTGPGPQVGRALAYLTEHVIDDPSSNTPERLKALLLAWRER